MTRFQQLFLDLVPSAAIQQASLLDAHYQLLKRWNRVLNLTAIRDEDEALRWHYAESAALAHALPQGSLRVADIGSGAGFPGIPVAVLRPEFHVTVIESHQRKAAFLKEATRGWSNVTVLAQRAEAVDASFDWLISRAVRPGEVLRLIPRLAHAIGLLTEDGEATRLARSVSTILWGPSVPTSFVDGHCVLLGRSVPRAE
jgi:16S rRNA (guanine527-N7)-methyltransferase